jgi:hypothetical protein
MVEEDSNDCQKDNEKMFPSGKPNLAVLLQSPPGHVGATGAHLF